MPPTLHVLYDAVLIAPDGTTVAECLDGAAYEASALLGLLDAAAAEFGCLAADLEHDPATDLVTYAGEVIGRALVERRGERIAREDLEGLRDQARDFADDLVLMREAA